MEAYLYDKLEKGKVVCRLCSHMCVIPDGERGICCVRENRGGTLETLVYGRLVAHSVDPIEKKPLFHLAPGSLSYSIATVGCNFKCSFCQNSDIAQMPADRNGLIIGASTPPESVVAEAVAHGCKSVAYTYTEPTVYFEYAYETSKLVRDAGLKNVFVTNGFMSEEALRMISPYLDAANVDLKAFSNEFYKTRCGGRLAPVLRNLKLMKSLGIFVEITTLLIPGLNDDYGELKALAEFIFEELGAATPWHISRFHPAYRMTGGSVTPAATLSDARRIGFDAGLLYVYTGNIPGDDGENTFCPGCGHRIIERWGFKIVQNALDKGCCAHCGTRIDGIQM